MCVKNGGAADKFGQGFGDRQYPSVQNVPSNSLPPGPLRSGLRLKSKCCFQKSGFLYLRRICLLGRLSMGDATIPISNCTYARMSECRRGNTSHCAGGRPTTSGSIASSLESSYNTCADFAAESSYQIE